MHQKFFKIASLATLLICSVSCGPKQSYEYPYQNPKLPVEERVENLMSLLTPEEKIGLLMNKNISIDRLGIPSYNWWSEACHGVCQDGYTVYPQYIGLSATFNPELVFDVFDSVSDEARANWNRSEREFNVDFGARYYPGNPELSFWCPNVNIVRDPRWGRGQESPGEDPYLSSVMGVQTVKGMQGNDDRYYKTHACAKHYAVHSGPEPLRHRMDVSVSQRDLWETYLPAFKALVTEADVREVMCAYHRYESIPCCSNERLLVDILREKWGYEAIVLTDCDAINNYYTKGQHETQPDAKHASADAILHGTDLECGISFIALKDALKEGMIKESDLDGHLRRVLTGRFELGMFDPAEMLPWANLGPEVISSEANDALAVQSAREGMVLLKNEGVLPLSKDVRKLLVVGPNADNVEMLNGNYGGTPTDEHKRSILEGIRRAVPGAEIIYDKACELEDEYTTTSLMDAFNGGKGLLASFYGDRKVGGKAKLERNYASDIEFSTFGAWGFAEGVDADDVAVKLSGTLLPDFSGKVNYNISSDNGYILKVNGKVVEKAAAGGRMRRWGKPQYKSFEVTAGKPVNVEVEYVRGSGPYAMLSATFCRRELTRFDALAAKAADADAILVIGGITARQEGEGGDRPDIELPAVQQSLLKAMHATGKPVVFVNCSGSAMALASVEDQYDALIQAWYGGQGGAYALADIIFGDYNPSGKLPVTFYASTDQLPDFLNYDMDGRTYRYFEGSPLYPFGYGLSYTSFEYGKAKLSKKSVKAGAGVDVTIPVTNCGDRDGEEVVQVYVKSLDNPEAPIKALKGFEKVNIKAGKTVNVKVSLRPDSFAYYDASVDGLSILPGNYKILYGSSSADEDLQELDFQVL
ncbi:MAG: glycoside hydrolase family 3 C-terminal domain-containing protein [Candidatus Cryptobacteroides sp.]|nr:glycoside hydrolase family 3 C-terminal domain-containing protein [Rikenellaceae bacterium]MDY5747153.1 glycoside hydrolase family 3 C-terminal domain-containing protein [Candidatus Cryptobacteroides sp.]